MGLGPALRRGRGPEVRAPAARRGRRSRALAVPDLEQLRYVFDAVALIRNEPRRARAADRLLRQPVHARLLHDRGRRQRRLPPREVDALLAPRPAAPHPRRERARGDRVPQRADRGGRAGGACSSTPGAARSRDARLPGVLARLLAPGARGRSRATHDGRVVPRILFTKGGGHWLEAMADVGRRRARHRLADAARRSAPPRGRPRRAAGQPGSDGAFRHAARRSRPRRSASWTLTAPVRATCSTSATASRSTPPPEHVAGARRGGARALPRGPRALGSVKKNICLDVIAYSHAARSRALPRRVRRRHCPASRNHLSFQ